jgi:hypothetical protein
MIAMKALGVESDQQIVQLIGSPFAKLLAPSMEEATKAQVESDDYLFI